MWTYSPTTPSGVTARCNRIRLITLSFNVTESLLRWRPVFRTGQHLRSRQDLRRVEKGNYKPNIGKWLAMAMHSSMGNDSTKLVRATSSESRARFADSGGARLVYELLYMITMGLYLFLSSN